jgi:hypothetical protein
MFPELAALIAAVVRTVNALVDVLPREAVSSEALQAVNHMNAAAAALSKSTGGVYPAPR